MMDAIRAKARSHRWRSLQCVVLTVASTLACRSSLPGWETNPSVADEAAPARTAAVEHTGSNPAPPPLVDEDAGSNEPDSAGDPNVPQSDERGASSAEAVSDEQTSESSPPLPKPLHAKVNASCGNDPGVGQRLKSFELPTPDGKSVSPRSYAGRVLLVNFWGTWCKPCLEELPEFDQLYRRYRKHGMTLVAIATDEDAGAVREFVAKRKIAAKILIRGEAYAGQYASDKFPFTFVVNPKGVIVASYRGYRPECMGKLEADVRAQLEAHS